MDSMAFFLERSKSENNIKKGELQGKNQSIDWFNVTVPGLYILPSVGTLHNNLQ